MMGSNDYEKRVRPAGLVRRFRHLVVETDWDCDFVRYARWMDLFSWGVVAASLFYLINVSLSAFCR